jgi:hypothetical protein
MNPDNMLNGRKGALLAVAAAGVSLYWMFTYSGPYRYLAELQLKWFGSYVPKLTVIVVMLGALGVAALIRLVFRGAERRVPGPTTPTVSAPNAVPTAAADSLLRYVRYGILLVPFGLGGYAYYNGTHAGGLQQLGAQDFQGEKLHARIVYADVRGRLSGQYMSKGHYLYIPMTEDGKLGGPLHLLVGVDEKEMRSRLHREADGSFTVRGVADKGLEGDLKYAFEKNGIAVGEPCWVLHTGREPSSDRTFGLAIMGLGIAFAGVIFGVESYRKKKNMAAQPLRVTA